jgi:GNAT superfamily N-acetyltransferase
MDMLVRLYALPDGGGLRRRLAQHQIIVRRAMAHEKAVVVDWIGHEFGAQAKGWKCEGEVAFARQPVSCWIALEARRICGFACHDVTARNFFGPIGVSPACRMKGVGSLLVLSALGAMRDQGYAYAVIGCVGPTAFFQRCVDAIPIAGSTPGLYPPGIEF